MVWQTASLAQPKTANPNGVRVTRCTPPRIFRMAVAKKGVGRVEGRTHRNASQTVSHACCDSRATDAARIVLLGASPPVRLAWRGLWCCCYRQCLGCRGGRGRCESPPLRILNINTRKNTHARPWVRIPMAKPSVTDKSGTSGRRSLEDGGKVKQLIFALPCSSVCFTFMSVEVVLNAVN